MGSREIRATPVNAIIKHTVGKKSSKKVIVNV